MGAWVNERRVRFRKEREGEKSSGNWTEREGEQRKWAYNKIREMSEGKF